MDKKILLLILSLFLLSTFANTVNAQDSDLFESVISFFGESQGLKYLTVDLASDFNSGSPSTEAQGIAKILFMLLFFTVLFGASSLAPGIKTFDKKLRISITFLVALIAGLTIPTTWLSFVVQTYGGLFVLGLLLVPAVVLLYANFKWVEGDDRGTQFVKFMFMAALLFIFQHVKNVVGGMDIGILKFFAGAAEVVFGAFMFWYLAVGVIFGKSEEAKEKAEEDEGLLGKIWNLFKKGKELQTTKEKAKKEIKEKAKKEIIKVVPPEKRARRNQDFTRRMLGVLENSLYRIKQGQALSDPKEIKNSFDKAVKAMDIARRRGIGVLEDVMKDITDSGIQNEIKVAESELLRLYKDMSKTDIVKNPSLLKNYQKALEDYIALVTTLMKKIKVY